MPQREPLEPGLCWAERVHGELRTVPGARGGAALRRAQRAARVGRPGAPGVESLGARAPLSRPHTPVVSLLGAWVQTQSPFSGSL